MIKAYEGKPCKKCGNPFRYESTKECIFCTRERRNNRTVAKKSEQIANLKKYITKLETENANLRDALGDETLIKHILRLETELKRCQNQYQGYQNYHLERMRAIREAA